MADDAEEAFDSEVAPMLSETTRLVQRMNSVLACLVAQLLLKGELRTDLLELRTNRKLPSEIGVPRGLVTFIDIQLT